MFETLIMSDKRSETIPLHGPEAFEGMRRAGRLTAEALDLLVDHVNPGTPTDALDKLIFEFALDHGAYSATLGYRGYKKSICTSINHVVCHGMPNDKPLKEGDIIEVEIQKIGKLCNQIASEQVFN